jgi:hypothetical protein
LNYVGRFVARTPNETHYTFAEMTPDKRPQDSHMDGTDLRFETLDHSGEYPDTMPQAIN